MKSKEFIIEKLKVFVKVFTETKVRYEFDEVANVHTVEVSPIEFQNRNDEVLDWEVDFFKDFIGKFPYESIGFCSVDALIGIRNVDFEAEGCDFNKPSFNAKFNSITQFDYSINQIVANVPTISSIEYSNSNVYSYYSSPNAA